MVWHPGIFAPTNVSCCVCCTGESESSIDVKTVNTSNDIAEHDDMSKPYSCTVCDERFTKKGDLDVHKLTTHSGENLHFCSVCQKCFRNQKNLRRHMNIHSSKYMCNECGNCFRSNRELTVHGRVHSGEKPFECAVCSKRFTRAALLAQHRRTHSGEKPYKCHMCDKAFSQAGTLNTHMSVHTADKPYECLVCKKSFSRPVVLQRHRHTIHTDITPRPCPYCGKLFKTNGDVTRHVRIHTGAKPYSCRHCSDSFTFHESLKVHMLRSHNEGTWWTCYICQKKFVHSLDLKKHISWHVGVKPYICSECPKRFRTAQGLTNHLLVHSDIKQFLL